MAATFATPSTVIGLAGSSVSPINTKPLSSCNLTFSFDHLNNYTLIVISCDVYSLSKTNIDSKEPSETRRSIGRKIHLVGYSLFSKENITFFMFSMVTKNLGVLRKLFLRYFSNGNNYIFVKKMKKL